LTVTVTARDRFGNTATGYRGTVHFTSSDTATGVVLPGDYPFTAADAGVHTFSGGVTLVTVGTQTVTATDAANSSITGQASVNVTHAQSGNLIVNGGFETGDFTGWTTVAALDTSFFGVSGDNPHSGTFAAFFGSYSTERDDIFQDVPTIPGHTYHISYWVANLGGGQTEIRSSWGGTVLEDLFPDNAFAYQQHTFDVVATSTSTELRIGGYQIPAYWYLDDVSVTDTTAGGLFRGGTGPHIAIGNSGTVPFSGPQAALPGDPTLLEGTGSITIFQPPGPASSVSTGAGQAGPVVGVSLAPLTAPAGANQAALDALMAGWALDGGGLSRSNVYGIISSPSGTNAGPNSPNGPSTGTVSNLPGDGDLLALRMSWPTP
jgi:hypothetical protein